MNIELSDAAKAARKDLRRVYEKAYSLFLDKLEIAPTPENYPLPYALCEIAKETRWPHTPFASLMVSTDLSETINELNAWREWLLHFSIWTEILDYFDEQEAWTIQHSYVDPLAQICLMQPSAVRDRFGHIATSAVHQANLGVLENYKDQLKQDEQKFPLSRKQAEAQLETLGSHWTKTGNFITTLRELDTETYREATRNYRNLASHAIAPRFNFGMTNLVVRSVGPATATLRQPDGSILITKDPSRRAVSYGLGGIQALNLREIYSVNLSAYNNSVQVFNSYSLLLEEILLALNGKKHLTGP